MESERRLYNYYANIYLFVKGMSFVWA